MNARDFVLTLADQLRQQGRDVNIEHADDYIGIMAPSRTIAETTVAASAIYSTYTNRWTFCGIRAYEWYGDTVEEKRRKRAHLIADVYGKSYVRTVTPTR